MSIIYLMICILIPSTIVFFLYAPEIKKWYFLDRHVEKADRLLQEGAIYQGLILHYQVGNYQGIEQYLATQLALPKNSPDNLIKKLISLLSADKLRPLITTTYKDLIQIKVNVSDKSNNRIPLELKSDVAQGVDFAADALFEICDCLTAVARQNIDLKVVKEEMQQEQERLQQLAKMVGETKQELAKLTFSHNRNDVAVDFSNTYFKQFVQTSKVLREQNNLTKDKVRLMRN